jgi:hypothetical protein
MTLVYTEQPLIINRVKTEIKSEINLKVFNLLMNIAVGVVFGFSLFIALIGLGSIEVLHSLAAGFPLFGAASSFLVLAFYLLKIKKETMATQPFNYLKTYLQSDEGKTLFDRMMKESLTENKVN